MKNILIINSLPGLDPVLEDALAGLHFKGWNFYVWSAKKNAPFFSAGRPADVRGFFRRISGGGKLNWIFRLTFPFLCLTVLIRLALLKRKVPLKKIMAIGLKEKLILDWPARRLKMEIVWVELPDNNPLAMRGWVLKKFSQSANRAAIICFSASSREKLLRLGINDKNIRRVPPGVKIPLRGQSNLFSGLAENGQSKNFQRKFFTVGAMADLSRKHKTEILFQAAAECVSAIPNLQLIIIGGGGEKNNLSWAAKKLKIDNRVWLIFEPGADSKNSSRGILGNRPEERLKIFNKWLPNFDIYVSINDEPRLSDFSCALIAMARGIPVIAPAGLGFEDFVIQNKTGCLMEMDLNEMLARQIIKLYQNTNMRFLLGENAAELVDKHFMLDNMVENMEEILDA